MYRMKSIFACVLIVLLGNIVSAAHARPPEAVASPKQATSPADQVAAEKSVLAESSKQAARAEAAAAEFCRCVGEGESSARKKIEQALASPLHQTGLDYTDQPLQDVVSQLSDEYRIPIQIDIPALEEAGIKFDTPITVNLHNISLRSALRLMLQTRQITYVIRDEVLVVTTPEDAEKNLKICVYDVRRITGENGNLTPLIDTISSCVAKETWAKNGKGSAEIRSPKPGLLVITQTQAVHDDIRNLLTTLDQMRHDHPSDVGAGPTKSATGGTTERRAPAKPAGNRDDKAGAENPFGG